LSDVASLADWCALLRRRRNDKAQALARPKSEWRMNAPKTDEPEPWTIWRALRRVVAHIIAMFAMS